jgi:hypothetical protein
MGHPQLSANIDLNGTTRPLGVGPDAGAIEFDDGSLAPQAAPVLLID